MKLSKAIKMFKNGDDGRPPTKFMEFPEAIALALAGNIIERRGRVGRLQIQHGKRYNFTTDDLRAKDWYRPETDAERAERERNIVHDLAWAFRTMDFSWVRRESWSNKHGSIKLCGYGEPIKNTRMAVINRNTNKTYVFTKEDREATDWTWAGKE